MWKDLFKKDKDYKKAVETLEKWIKEEEDKISEHLQTIENFKKLIEMAKSRSKTQHSCPRQARGN